MFPSLKYYLFDDLEISDRSTLTEILNSLSKQTKFVYFLVFLVIIVSAILFFLLYKIKESSDLAIYVVAIILLYELFLLKKIYKMKYSEQDSYYKKENSFVSNLMNNLNSDIFSRRAFLLDEQAEIKEDFSFSKIDNIEYHEKFSDEGNDLLKKDSILKSNINTEKPKIQNKKLDETVSKENILNESIENMKLQSNKTFKNKNIQELKENESHKNSFSENINKKNKLKDEDKNLDKFESKIENEYKKVIENSSPATLKNRKRPIKIKIEKEEKKPFKNIDSTNIEEKILPNKIKIEKEESERTEKFGNLNEDNKEIKKIKIAKPKNIISTENDCAKENLNDSDKEKSKNNAEPIEDIHKESYSIQDKKIGRNTKDESQEKNNKINSEKSEADIYLARIKEKITLKNETLNKMTIIRENLDSARKEVTSYLKEFKTNFNNLVGISEKIEHILLSIGIPLSIQKYELEELENETQNKYTLEETGLNIIKNEVKGEDDHKKVKFTFERNNGNNATEPIENIRSNAKKIQDEPLNIKKSLNFIEALLIFEAIISFIFLIFLIFNFFEYFKFLKILIILFLIVNIFIGVYSMVLSEILNKKCLLKEKEGCKQNAHKINELVMLLNKNSDLKEDHIELIKNEFDKIVYLTDKNIEAMENYLKNVFKSKIGIKIFIFETLIDKLRFIEGDFDEISQKLIDKKLFYTNVDLVARSLEKIKNFVNSTNTYKIIDAYKDLVVTNSFFKNEKSNVSENISRIIKLDSAKENRHRTAECKRSIKKACNSVNIVDEMSFVLIFCYQFSYYFKYK